MPVRSQFLQNLKPYQPGLEDVLGCNSLGWLQEDQFGLHLMPGPGVQLVVDAGAHHHQRAEGGQGGRPSYVRGGPEISTLD